MQNIIDTLKAATAPSRELDIAIAQATPVEGWRVCDDGVVECYGDQGEGADWFHSGQEVPAYTRSIDAAVKLIPDGMFWIAGCGRTRPDEPLAGASVVTPEDQLNPVGEAEGDHVAICLCIAALEARLSLKPTN